MGGVQGEGTTQGIDRLTRGALHSTITAFYPAMSPSPNTHQDKASVLVPESQEQTLESTYVDVFCDISRHGIDARWTLV